MAFQDPSHSQIDSSEDPKFFYGLIRVVGTRGNKPAVTANERRHQHFIGFDQKQDDSLHACYLFAPTAWIMERYWARIFSQEASWTPFLVTTIMSTGKVINSLFLLNNSLTLLRTLFL